MVEETRRQRASIEDQKKERASEKEEGRWPALEEEAKRSSLKEQPGLLKIMGDIAWPYYGWLLPWFALVTVALIDGAGGVIALCLLMGAIPGLNWFLYLGALVENHENLPRDAILIASIAWAIVGLPVTYFTALCIRKRRCREAEAARLQRYRKEQQKYHKELLDLGERSLGLFESLPRHLESAEECLNQAEADFAGRAFAPFWDSIKRAAKCLAHFDKGVRQIQDASSRYTALISKYEDTPPQFPLARQSVEKLVVGTATAERMQAIVRKAQRDFQFAMIYEQRKTNQILVAGFKSLAEALERMTWQISASIDALVGSVSVMTSTLSESMRAIHSRLGDLAEMTSQQHGERAARPVQRRSLGG